MSPLHAVIFAMCSFPSPLESLLLPRDLEPDLLPRDFEPNRLADDKLWDRLMCKGGSLLQLTGDPKAAQSPWKGDLKSLLHPDTWSGYCVHMLTDLTAEELETWGYKDIPVGGPICDQKNYWNVETACNALGLSTKPASYGGDNLCYKFEHFDSSLKDENGASVPKSKQTYTVNNKQYRATSASFELAVNLKGGVIFQQYVESPKRGALNVWNKEPSPEELPELRSLSDMMWGAWVRENKDVKNINYFWVQGIGNTNTKAVIARALKNAGKELQKWPGTTFGMDSEEGMAILGTENAACFGFFLAMHKTELGDKTIEKVTVFRSDAKGNVDPDMIFYVRDGSPS